MNGVRPPAPAGIAAEHLAALSHEMRTPLSGVLGMARLLAATRLSQEQRAYVAAIETTGDHLLGLVNDILDYARLGAAEVTLNPTHVDVEALLRSVCELLSPRAHAKGIEIAWAAQGGLGSIRADEGRLRQILLNLAGNAIKFVAEGGVLLLAERAASGGLRLSVSDTGPGIPPEARETVFEPFARLARPAGGDPEGAGLGLAIVRRLAVALGGRADVDSAPGGGSNFWFEAPGLIDSRRHGPSLGGRSVAVVSASATVREAAVRQIEASGGKALPASDLAEAGSAWRPSDVILVDHAPDARRYMPPGGRAIVMLRPQERRLIGAYRRAGFAGYLIKPLRRVSMVLRVLAVAGAGPDPSLIPDDDRIEEGPVDGEAGPVGGGRVLLAEDDPINAMLARTLLRREGCAVDHVTDGAAALKAVRKTLYDLVLMDVRMPGVGGLEATRRLRRMGVPTPVVALTADGSDEDRRACLAAGMNDFLVKPLDRDGLRRTIARWAGSEPPLVRRAG